MINVNEFESSGAPSGGAIRNLLTIDSDFLIIEPATIDTALFWRVFCAFAAVVIAESVSLCTISLFFCAQFCLCIMILDFL